MLHSKQVVQKTAEESASLICVGDSFFINPCDNENCSGGVAECFIGLICFGDSLFIEPVLDWVKCLFAKHTSDSSMNYNLFLK